MSRVALITGGSEGIGLAIAKQLAARGITPIVAARRLERAQAAASQIPSATAVSLDVTSDESVRTAVDSVLESHGRIDVLVNNAGINIDGQQTASEADLTVVYQTFETNFFGAWRMATAVVPAMRTQRYGRIVNVSSGMGAITELAGAEWPAYRTSKTALNSLTRTLAAELESTGILVNAACPGWVRTKLGGAGAPLSVEQGADTPVWLATLPDDGPTGGFFRARQPAAW